MSPSLSVDDFGNSRRTNSVFLGEVNPSGSGCVEAANLNDFLVRKLSLSLSFASCRKFRPLSGPMIVSSGDSFTSALTMAFSFAVSVLGYHISRVFCLGPEKQMRRIHAWRIVASVKDAHLPRLDSCGYKKGNPSGIQVCIEDSDLPVVPSVLTSRPFPALIRALFINFLPKVDLVYFRQFWDGIVSHVASLLRYVISVCRKLNTTGERAYISGHQNQSQAL